jgi:hypothetical protein
MAVKLQAREIVRAAKRHGITLGGIYRNCAVSVIGKTAGLNFTMEGGSRFRQRISEATGYSYDDIFALECGYMGWEMYGNTKNPYFKVGERTRKLAKS